MASLGAPDRRLNSQGQLHYVLQQQLKGYSRVDPPATRVQPIPFTLVEHLNATAHTILDQAVADIATIGFFFLLRPGEHTHSPPAADSHPFRLQDVTFRIGGTTVSAASGCTHLIPLATFVTLTFTKQKNGTENEVVGHARSGHQRSCPVLALIRRTLHLRSNPCSPSTTLCTVYLSASSLTFITPAILTATLRHAAQFLFPTLGFHPSLVSARALRAGGAMSLLCADVNSDVIKLLGRWRSDEMLRYLHLQAYPKMQHMAARMSKGGTFQNLR